MVLDNLQLFVMYSPVQRIHAPGTIDAAASLVRSIAIQTRNARELQCATLLLVRVSHFL